MAVDGPARPTLASIAAAAGVSLPTVSKVVNGKADVAPATRERVRALLAEYNYVPIHRRGNEAPLVDLVFTALDSPWAIEIIRGVGESGVDAVVSARADAGGGWARNLMASGRQGAIIVTSTPSGTDSRALARSALPVVVIDPADLPGPEVPSVGATNWAGGLAATEHLVRLGHRRVGMIAGPRAYLCSRARIDGYRAGLDRAGLTPDPDLVREGDFDHDGGFAAARELLAAPDPPTALFVSSDAQAFGVIEAAREAGMSVPADLSIVGFDDLPVARWASPPLTTVRQPLAEMGRVAARMLGDLIARTPLESRRVELATQLVTRASTAPPRG